MILFINSPFSFTYLASSLVYFLMYMLYRWRWANVCFRWWMFTGCFAQDWKKLKTSSQPSVRNTFWKAQQTSWWPESFVLSSGWSSSHSKASFLKFERVSLLDLLGISGKMNWDGYILLIIIRYILFSNGFMKKQQWDPLWYVGCIHLVIGKSWFIHDATILIFSLFTRDLINCAHIRLKVVWPK